MGQQPSLPISNESASSSKPALLFSNGNFEGNGIVVYYGEYPSIETTGVIDNTLSGIKLAPFTTAILYEERNFAGRFVQLSGPVEIPYLNDIWRNTSSIKIIFNEPTMDTKLLCCKGQLSGGTCDPYLPGSVNCDTAVANFCSTNMQNLECQTYCRENPTKCDAAVIKYCGQNPTDPFCACIVSAANANNINPKCVDRRCLESGYLTSNMRTEACPSIITCNVYANLSNSGIQLSTNIPVQQNCGAGQSDVVISTPANNDNDDKILMYLLILVVFLVFIMISIGVAYLIFDDSWPQNEWF